MEPIRIGRCIGIMELPCRELAAGKTVGQEKTLQEDWERLIEPHLEAGYRLAYLMLGDEEEARDAVQDALVRAWRNFDRFDRSLPVRPWWMRIVANTARNRLRSVSRYMAAVARANRPEYGQVRSAEAEYGEGQRAARVWQAISKLPLGFQEVLYLRYFLDMGAGECALTLGLAVGTVKSRTHRALGRLQRVIQRDFPDLWEGWHHE